MRYLFPAIYLLLFTAWLRPAKCQEKEIAIRLVQDDSVFAPGHEPAIYTLQKKTFRIQVLLQNIPGIYLFASLKDSLYNLPDNIPIPGFSALPSRVMAEVEHNKEKELLANDDGWSYWFYDPDSPTHRFNRKLVFLDSGRVVGTKTIKQIYFLQSRKTIKLKDLNEPLFLFFVAAEKQDKSGNPVKELRRIKVRINWREED
ncbi:MAG: hypothetical protein ACO25B_11825 [Chitinophagaceae bacterium]